MRERSALEEFVVDPSTIQMIGRDLHRPECILAMPNGNLLTSDARGGVMRIGPDCSQTLLGVDVPQKATQHAVEWAQPSLPNGLALAVDGRIVIADVGARAIRRLNPETGTIETWHSEVEGRALGIVNFVLIDAVGRTWFTVTTCCTDPLEAMNGQIADGYVGVIDDRGIRIVADGFCGTNELRIDATGERLYVVESYARRVSRLRIGKDAMLIGRETFGPSDLGPVPDGCAFDAEGNLWVTCVFAERLIAITPAGDVMTLFDGGHPGVMDNLMARLAQGAVTSDYMQSLPGNAHAPWLSSLTFGGPDLKTVYLGSGKGNRIAAFRSPVAGQPLAHWR